ncbi:hypothetical protein IGI04_014643 [Brassica rapa subsp. trilocularis]|uniref:Uncharacterized protein n=1 Tax=Brassica rapa subsp. trilocularis TaxID=1813537 RepID=A0ABQ7MMR5_BRACM|nr:hypothetical protein IGI04_014643 [Brassica rapa subsp. trilocularis]
MSLNIRETPIWTEEGTGFHKRVKRIHDPVKTVVPCTVFEAESPIPPDRSMQFSSHIKVLDDHQHVEASQRGLRFRDEVDKDPAEAALIDTDQIPSNDINKPASIDTTSSPSIDTRSGWRNHHAIRQVWGKEEEELEEEKKDQGEFSVFIDSSLLRWCQETQSAHQMLLTAISTDWSTPLLLR